MDSLSKGLTELGDEYRQPFLIDSGIQSPQTLFITEQTHVLLIGGVAVANKADVDVLICTLRDRGVYTHNTKIDFKLKINVREYLLLCNTLFPVLIRVSEVIENPSKI